MTSKNIQNRIKPTNCEWLVRPEVGLSEFAGTISANIPTLVAANGLVDRRFIEKFQETTQTVMDLCKKIDKDDKTTTPTQLDIRNLIKEMRTNEKLQVINSKRCTRLGMQ